MDGQRALVYWLLSAPGAAAVRKLSYERPIARLSDETRGKFDALWSPLSEKQRDATLAAIADSRQLPGTIGVTKRATFYLVDQVQDLVDLVHRPIDGIADTFALAGARTQLLDIIAFLSFTPLLSMPSKANADARRAMFDLIIDTDAPRADREALERAVYALLQHAYPAVEKENASQNVVQMGVRDGDDDGDDGDGGDEAVVDQNAIEVPTLIAHHIASRLPLRDRMILQRVSRSFDALIRRNDIEVYRAGFREAYPLFAEIFYDQLPPWFADASNARLKAIESFLRARIAKLANQAAKVSAQIRELERNGRPVPPEKRAELAQIETDAALARRLSNQLSVRNRLGQYDQLTEKELDIADTTRFWQLLFRSINAIATHPVVRHTLLARNITTAYSGPPIILDAGELLERGLAPSLESPLLPLADGWKHVEEERVELPDQPDRIVPTLRGRYFVFNQQLLERVHRCSLLDNPLSPKLQNESDEDKARVLGPWSALVTTDIETTFHEVSRYRIDYEGYLSWRAMLFSRTEPEQPPDVPWTHVLRTLRVVAAAEWHAQGSPMSQHLRLDVAVGAVDEVLHAALFRAAEYVAVHWTSASNDPSTIPGMLRRYLRTHDEEMKQSVIYNRVRPTGEMSAEDRIEGNIENYLERDGASGYHRATWFGLVFNDPAAVDLLNAQTEKEFLRLFESRDAWTAYGENGQFSALDYETLRAIFYYIVYSRASGKIRHNADPLFAMLPYENPRWALLRPSWDRVVNRTRSTVSGSRDVALSTIDNSEFLQSLTQLGFNSAADDGDYADDSDGDEREAEKRRRTGQ